jgi:hypothetical protein
MITLADVLIKIAASVLGMVKALGSEKRQRRDRAANYLDRVSSLLAEMTHDYRTRRNIDSKCAELEVALQNLSDVLAHAKINEDAAQLLVSALLKARVGPSNILRLMPFMNRNLLLDPFMNTAALSEPERQYVEKLVSEATSTHHDWGSASAAVIEEELRKIDQASGIFRGAAEALRALP